MEDCGSSELNTVVRGWRESVRPRSEWAPRGPGHSPPNFSGKELVKAETPAESPASNGTREPGISSFKSQTAWAVCKALGHGHELQQWEWMGPHAAPKVCSWKQQTQLTSQPLWGGEHLSRPPAVTSRENQWCGQGLEPEGDEGSSLLVDSLLGGQ